jgi:RimJ/RimL family protein N-acetyltransferase
MRGHGRAWIGTHQEQFEQGKMVNFAIVLRAEAVLVGAVGLRMDPRNTRAELGYWVGKAYWNRGYGTEAARAVLAYGFDALQLHRIFACYFAHNPASGRIMEHLGMKAEGRLRQHIQKWGIRGPGHLRHLAKRVRSPAEGRTQAAGPEPRRLNVRHVHE